MKDIKHQLEISLAIKRESMNDLARRWKVSHTHIRHTAMGKTTAEPTYNKIKDYIKQAKSVVHFSYVRNEQTNEQESQTRKRQLEAV